MKKLLLILSIMLMAHTIFGQIQQQTNNIENSIGTLIVKVQGLKTTDGQLIIGLYNIAADFPEKTPFKGSFTKISTNIEEITFENIPNGTYALFVWHDINNNGKMDKDDAKIPIDGLGFYNYVMEKMELPTFQQVSFLFAGANQTITIDMQYGLPTKQKPKQ